MDKISITDASVIEQVRESLPIATTVRNGLYGKSYVVKGFGTDTTKPNKLIKLFSCKRNGFSGKLSVLFRRSESTGISEFSIYSNASYTVENMSIIDIYRRSGNHSNITFYHDEKYVYAYMTSEFYYLYCKLDFLFVGELILEEQTGVDISTLTKISFTG